jgi:hypothetical protein
MIIVKSFEASHSRDMHIYDFQRHSLLLYHQLTTRTLSLNIRHGLQSQRSTALRATTHHQLSQLSVKHNIQLLLHAPRFDIKAIVSDYHHKLEQHRNSCFKQT